MNGLEKKYNLVIVGAEMKTFWKLHALILINSPKVAVVRSLALALADGGVEVVPVDDVVFADLATSYSHLFAWVFTKGDNC